MKPVTEMDMNKKNVKKSPPSFRPEVGGPERRFVGLTRVSESAGLKVCGEITPLVQPTAWREKEREGKRNREREIEMGERDLRSSRADLRHARCYSLSV